MGNDYDNKSALVPVHAHASHAVVPGRLYTRRSAEGGGEGGGGVDEDNEIWLQKTCRPVMSKFIISRWRAGCRFIYSFDRRPFLFQHVCYPVVVGTAAAAESVGFNGRVTPPRRDLDGGKNVLVTLIPLISSSFIYRGTPRFLPPPEIFLRRKAVPVTCPNLSWSRGEGHVLGSIVR